MKQDEPFTHPVIKEGKINSQALTQINLEESWLITTLKNLHQTDVNKVLLATIDRKNNLKNSYMNKITSFF